MRSARMDVPHIPFLCPLCQEVGATVLLEAELDRDSLTITDVSGACLHAEAFSGDGDLLTIQQQWRVTRAALRALSEQFPRRQQ